MSMYILILSPPIAFIIILLLSLLLSYLSAFLEFHRKDSAGALTKAYASGEEFKGHRVQPDYSQFFPFAFFFTILHVVTLMVASIPAMNTGSFVIAVIYILGAILGLMVLFRKDSSNESN